LNIGGYPKLPRGWLSPITAKVKVSSWGMVFSSSITVIRLGEGYRVFVIKKQNMADNIILLKAIFIFIIIS